jgi:SAM-dependent methyltransferase
MIDPTSLISSRLAFRWAQPGPPDGSTDHYPDRIWAIPTGHDTGQLRLLHSFVSPESVYLEIGAGDGRLTRTVARTVRYAYGVDVPDQISAAGPMPANCDLMETGRVNIPLGDDRVSVAFSDMLVGQLRTDELTRHLCEVARVLVPGGVYVCRVPHRYTAAADAGEGGRHEGAGGEGFSYRRFADRFVAAGFGSVGLRAVVLGRPVLFPGWVVRAAEALLGLLPAGLSRWLGRLAPPRSALEALAVVGWKDPRRVVTTSLPVGLSPGLN